MGMRRTIAGGALRVALAGAAGLASAGCAWNWPWANNQPAGLSKAQAELAAAHDLYKKGEYAPARRAFRHLADNKTNSPQIAEEARFFEAECLYKQDHWPGAVDVYHKALIDFPSGQYREQACQRMYEIANFWLNDTRAEMTAKEEKADGKRWLVVPAVVHFEKKKPLMDEEGRAVQALEQVHYSEPTGPYAAKALYLAGKVHFYRGNYEEADHFFTQLAEMYKDHELAPEAVELAIIAKHLSTGGPDYDGRKSAEALKLVHRARNSYPDLASRKGEFLDRQLASITLQQAEKDWRTAEFYRRTKHPGSAYFYYEVVRRRYPGTRYAEQAAQRMEQIRREVGEGKHEPGFFDTVFDDPQLAWSRLWGTPTPKQQVPADGQPPESDAQPPRESPAPPPRPIPNDMMPR